MTRTAQDNHISQTTLDTFARYARAIIAWRDPLNPGVQLICSVDDAWLFPGSVNIETRPSVRETFEAVISESFFLGTAKLGSDEAQGEWVGDVRGCDLSKLRTHLLGRTAGGKENPANAAKEGVAAPRVSMDDIFFALDLIEFCYDNDYGLCLCNFEAFYRNVATFNHESNAVLLDINHALLDDPAHKALTIAWTEAAPALLDWNGPIMLGWYLYYHLKLTVDGKERWPRTALRLDPKHLMIVSSKPDVGKDVNDVMRHVLAIARDNKKALPDCGYFLMPKTAPKQTTGSQDTGIHSQTVYELFNASFVDAARPEVKEEGILKDLWRLWKENDAIAYAHVSAENMPTVRTMRLNVSRWIGDMDSTAQNAVIAAELRALFRPMAEPEDKRALRVGTFWNILQFLAPSGPTNRVRYDLDPTGGFSQVVKFAPAIAPGAFLLLGIARFIRRLDDGGCRIELQERDKKVQVRISLLSGTKGEKTIGVVPFFTRLYQGGHGEGRKAVCHLLAGMPELYREVFHVKELSELEQAKEAAVLVGGQHGGMHSNIGCFFDNDCIVLTIGDVAAAREGKE